MKFLKYPVFLIVLPTFLFLLIQLSACKKENDEVNYQRQAQAAENLFYIKHNIIQLTLSHFKAITNQNLETMTGTHIDGGWTTKEVNTPGVSYHFRFINNDNMSVGDDIFRERYGIMKTICDTAPLALNANTRFEFTNFGFSNKPYLPYAQYPLLNGTIELKLVSIDANRYEFEQTISNLQFTDSTGKKTITLDGTLTYEWQKATESSYFSPEHELFLIRNAELEFVNHNNDVVNLELTASAQYPAIYTQCGVLKGGEGNLAFIDQTPSSAVFSYENIDTVCNIGAQMVMADLPFRLTIDDWSIN
ncbi:MAG: hypothetical protein PF694_10530 [Bacteroidetes bacterium]|jgi:hypothetical protein|nr:hypothetical protein [Bacteroidota bacterium]